MNGVAKLAGPGAVAPWRARLALVAALVAGVYFAGTSWFSQVRMEPLFYPMLASLFHTRDANQLYDYLSALRYAIHYVEYLVLFLLAVWLLGMRPLPALLLSIALAAADEGHQYFVPERSCSLRDLNFDAAGAVTAFLATVAARRLRGPAACARKRVDRSCIPNRRARG